MSILGEILSGKIRQEMKNRVDQVLKAGDEWSKTAKELITALNGLTEAIKTGGTDPKSLEKSLEGVAKGAKRLTTSTKNLTKAFESHNRTLEKVLTKVEG